MERPNPRRKGRNNVYWGAFLGFTFPMLGFMLYYIFLFSDRMSLEAFWDALFEKKLMSSLLSLSILMNLPVFFLNLWTQRNETVKGILGATLFYGLLIILFKFS